MRPEIELLEHHADVAPHAIDLALRRAHASAVALAIAEQFAFDAHVALVVGFERGEAAQQRALARARRPDDADHFRSRDVEIDAAQHFDFAEAFAAGCALR